MRNTITISKGFGWFLGSFSNNKSHKHYAIQLSIPLAGPIKLVFDKTEILTEKAVLIKSHVRHALSAEQYHLLFLFNPISTVGHFWNNLINTSYQEADVEPIGQLKRIGTDFLHSRISEEELRIRIVRVVHRYDCHCDEYVHAGDQRIDRAIHYLSQHSHRVVPLEEISEYCHLSPSRFLHLFKETTSLTYRRAQLWTKMINALPYFGQLPLTTIAHRVGFADSAHFSRTFSENFGFSPRELGKNSQFVQV
ncbi:MAG: AraC family transcriptional regulator [Tunicatimonas sp.]